MCLKENQFVFHVHVYVWLFLSSYTWELVPRDTSPQNKNSVIFIQNLYMTLIWEMFCSYNRSQYGTMFFAWHILQFWIDIKLHLGT